MSKVVIEKERLDYLGPRAPAVFIAHPTVRRLAGDQPHRILLIWLMDLAGQQRQIQTPQGG